MVACACFLLLALAVTPCAVASSGFSSASREVTSEECFVDLVMLWPTVEPWWNEITSAIAAVPKMTVVGSATYRVAAWVPFMRALYAGHDISASHIDNKALWFEQWAIGRPAAKASHVRVLWTRIDAPQFREFTKHHHTSRGNIDMEALKYRIRAAYKGRVYNYTHDVTMHAGDNREQALHVERLLLFNASKAFRDTAARADAACDAPQTRLR